MSLLMGWLLIHAVALATPKPMPKPMAKQKQMAKKIAQPTPKPTRLFFTGDVMLSREVEHEMALNAHLPSRVRPALRAGASPWVHMGDFFKQGTWVMGNFEGSVGESCPHKGDKLCFAVAAKRVAALREAGFTAMGLENNHSADLGDAGRQTTRSAILDAGMAAVDYANAPLFWKSQGHTFAFIALNQVMDKEGARVEIPSAELRQKLRLARALADWVIVNIHWGAEFIDWALPEQKAQAKWLIEQGADVIMGHHPHVVQPPECIMGRPVFFSLGNHVFDQKYPQTKRGMIAECTVRDEQLSCLAIPTQTSAQSSFPELQPGWKQFTTHQTISDCRVDAAKPVTLEGYAIRPQLAEHDWMAGELILRGEKAGVPAWTTPPRHYLALEKGRLTQDSSEKPLLFTLERHPSPLDQEIGPRPYVYDVGPYGLIAKWRGSALAWPLLDAQLIAQSSDDPAALSVSTQAASARHYLCALHRKDSFLTLNPNTRETRTALYQWNGFGFSGAESQALSAQCQRLFDTKPLIPSALSDE